MITGGNKQQRPGRSYLHGVVRDAARPFAYRNSMRRMLQAGGGSGMRAQYGNGFMPVNFKYRQFSFYGHDSLMPGAPEHGIFDAPAANELPARRADLVSAVTAPVPPESARADAPMRAVAQSDVPVLTENTLPLPAVAQATAIRIPGDGGPRRGRSTADEALGGDSGPQSANRGKSPADAKPAVVPVSGPQRMPAAMSLANLAMALEQHNFTNTNSVAVAAPASGVSGQRFPARPRIFSREPGKDAAQPVITGIRSRALIKSATREPRRASAPAPGATTVKPRLESAMPAIPVPRAPVRMEPLRKHRSPPPRQRREQHYSASQKQQSTRGKSRNLRAPRYKPARHQRPAIVRQSAPAAFWERNYLSRLQFRMYR